MAKSTREITCQDKNFNAFSSNYYSLGKGITWRADLRLAQNVLSITQMYLLKTGKIAKVIATSSETRIILGHVPA